MPKSASVNPIVTPTSNPQAPGGFSYWDWLVNQCDYDLFQVFGDTSAGKTHLMMFLAEQCAKEGKKVLYIDTEGGAGRRSLERAKNAGVTYERALSQQELKMRLKLLGNEKWESVVVDSPTLFLNEHWSEWSVQQRGEALQTLAKSYGYLKRYSQKNNAVGLIVAQPTSKMMNPTLDIIGEKAQYFVKVTTYIRLTTNENGEIIARQWVFWKARDHPGGKPISDIRIDDAGVHLDVDRLKAVMI